MMETGQLMSFLSYVMQILMNLMMISMVIVMVTMGRASLQRIFEVLDEKIDLVIRKTRLRKSSTVRSTSRTFISAIRKHWTIPS